MYFRNFCNVLAREWNSRIIEIYRLNIKGVFFLGGGDNRYVIYHGCHRVDVTCTRYRYTDTCFLGMGRVTCCSCCAGRSIQLYTDGHACIISMLCRMSTGPTGSMGAANCPHPHSVCAHL